MSQRSVELNGGNRSRMVSLVMTVQQNRWNNKSQWQLKASHKGKLIRIGNCCNKWHKMSSSPQQNMRNIKNKKGGNRNHLCEGPDIIYRIQKCQRSYHKWVSRSLENQGTVDGSYFLMQNTSKEIVPLRNKWKFCLWKLELCYEKQITRSIQK